MHCCIFLKAMASLRPASKASCNGTRLIASSISCFIANSTNERELERSTFRAQEQATVLNCGGPSILYWQKAAVHHLSRDRNTRRFGLESPWTTFVRAFTEKGT